VKICSDGEALRIEPVEWWEMIDWNEMKNAYEVLPEEIKHKIEEQGLAPAKEKDNASMTRHS